MRVVIDPLRLDPRKLDRVVQALQNHQVIIYPTDSGYAFGCSLDSAQGIATIRKLKGMDEHHPKPLAIILRSIAEIAQYGHVSNRAFRLLRKLLPGPYTFVLEAKREVPRNIKNRAREIGVRIPKNPCCEFLVEQLGVPLVTSSVSLSEDTEELVEPAELLRRYDRDVAFVVDAGAGWPAPSTILRVVGEEVSVLRLGSGPLPEDLGIAVDALTELANSSESSR